MITGGARRIGAAIVREVHAMGMDVVIHFNSSTAAAQQLATELNAGRIHSAHLIQSDLASSTCETLIDRCLTINGRLDVLINNASVFYPTPLTDISHKQWDEMINVNLRAPFLLCKAAASHLAAVNGCIINLTDIYGEHPLQNHLLYSISKAGLIMLTQSLAKELGPAVRVNAISPGAILWPEHLNETEKKAILENTVLKRQGEPGDIARAVRYLIDGATYATGQVLVLDGGRMLYS